MGFLSGVLKDVSEKQPYSVGKITLKNLVSNVINNNLRSGREGFKELFDVLPKEIAAYNSEVRQGNEKVKSVMGKILLELKAYKKEYIEKTLRNIIDPVKPMTSTEKNVTQAKSLVAECQKFAKEFTDAVNIKTKTDATKNAIKDLNPKLRDTIENLRRNVEHESKRLKELSSKESKDLEATEHKINKTLSSLKVNVDCRIDAQMKELIKRISEKVNEILKELNEINSNLLHYVDTLQVWIEKAEAAVEAALKQVENILEYVNEGSTFNKVSPIYEAADGLKKQADMLYDAGEEARKKVIETVKTALNAVKDMDEALKKDLYSVKSKIKEAVQQLGKTLEGNVKEGLWTIESAITGPLSEIVRYSGQFFDKFQSTKYALQMATGQVLQDIRNLVNISRFDHIMNIQHSKITAPLLTAIGRNRQNPFQPLTDYFSKLDDVVMQRVKEAIDKIGSGIRVGDIGNVTLLQSRLKTAKLGETLKALQSIAEEAEPSDLPDASKIRIEGLGTMKDIVKLDLNSHTSNLSEIITKVNSNGMSPSEKLTKTDVEAILSDLGNIAKTVSEHSHNVLDKVMAKIESRVASEVKGVAVAIQEKFGEIYSGLESPHTDVSLNGSKNVSGLQHLLNDFASSINQRISELKDNVIPQAFKKNPPGSTGSKNYDFGSNLMTAFNNMYNSNFSNGDIKTSGGAGDRNVLDEEIGGDGMTTVGATNRISDLAPSKFTNYRDQVNQETLATILDDNMENLTGTLPAAIKKIREQVRDALSTIEYYSGQAATKYAEVNNQLGALCGAIQYAAELDPASAKTELTILKDTYFKKYSKSVSDADSSIKKIKHDLTELQKTLVDKPIDLTKKLLKFTSDAEKHFADELKKEVEKDIQNAEKALTSHARWQYVDSIKFLLQACADKVREDVKALSKVIDTDLTIGFKGFMKAVEGEVTEGETTGQNIKKLSSLAADPVDLADKKQAFQTLSENFKNFWSPLASYVNKEIVRLNEEQNNNKHPVVKDVYDYHGQLIAIYDTFNEALTHIKKTHRYDHTLPELLDNVDAAIANLKPDGFAKLSSPAIDGLIEGLTHFVGEMRRAYISPYDGETFGELVKNPDDDKKSELTKEGRNVAKTFLTILATLFHDLDRLRGESRSLSKQKINQSTDLGRTMRDLGYSVSVHKQDGELQNKETMCGDNVYKRILWPIKEADANEHLAGCESRNHDRNEKFHLIDVLNCICSHVEGYNHVSHCATFAAKSQPCSVFEMLIWFVGLPYNNAYAELKSDGFTDLLDNPAKPLTDDEDIIVYDMDSFYIDACPRKFTYKNIRTVLHHICTKSYDILCAIGGHGDADTIYGIDFCNNSFGLKYPQSGADCLQMFLDVLRRILPPLRYLFKRCGVKADQFGWSDCLYGRNIATGKSQCTEHSSDKPKCQPTSPLMSYLNDCLPGHLPHQLSAIGCKAECKTCPTSKPGMPCLTPLGFRGFSGSTRKGWDLYETLSYFFGTNLISSLLCVVTKPPSTLPEHFGFALSLVNKWHESGTHLIKDAFHSSTLSRSIGLYDQTATLTDALRNAYGSTQNGRPNREVKCADLSSLSTSTAIAEQTAYTAPYLHSLCYDAYYYVAKKHVNAYLSWALYLPWDLHKYLENLHDALKNIFCRDWGCITCLRADKCKKGEHGIIEGACKCSSVVSCRGVLPTLYKYGFVFDDAKSLTASEKTCFAFIQQVQNVIRSTYFTELFDRCDDFMFTIRAPFLWMTVALWSLSLFYLICVMVGRLDVLHIKSHLRTPSSHKITAQSLLAAAQVGRLAKISYLQP